MKFSLYSEIQSWPGKSAEQLYGEVLEQIVNADRLGYDAYAVIEHFFFPKFSISASPLALFAAAAQRTRNIIFRTLLHSMPYHNPPVLASQIAVADILLGGRYEFGVGRGHGWMPPKAGLALTPESRERYEESVELLFTALENERFSFDGKHFQIADSGIVPRPERKFRVFVGGTSDRTYELAAERGWAVVVPPLLPYAALKDQLDLYRAKCAEHGNEPDIVWIHACYIDEDREVARREAEEWMVGFLRGNASPLTEFEPPPTDELLASGYGFYAAGHPREARGDPVRRDDRRRHRLGRHAGGRDRADRGRAGRVRGSDRGLDHRQRGRRRALAGDQGAGALRPHGGAALPGLRARGGRRPHVIERVCVVGGGVIGSLFAAHLSRVSEVWVLTRRPEHARALEQQGLDVSGRAGLHAASSTPPTIPRRCRRSTSASSRRRARRSRPRPRRARGPLSRRDDRHRPERPRRRDRSSAATATGRSSPASRS